MDAGSSVAKPVPLAGVLDVIIRGMLTRRKFISVAAAGLPAVAFYAKAGAAEYDLLIKGGRVMDPSRKFDQVTDVAIKGGRVAAVQGSIPASSAAEVLDATGKYVVPGLIDIHTHAGREKEDAALCLADGVTSLIDAGSAGARSEEHTSELQSQR